MGVKVVEEEVGVVKVEEEVGVKVVEEVVVPFSLASCPLFGVFVRDRFIMLSLYTGRILFLTVICATYVVWGPDDWLSTVV